MNLSMLGCTHREANLDLRQKLAFDRGQTESALSAWKEQFGGVELALLSTCNRTELYAAGGDELLLPSRDVLADQIAAYRHVPSVEVRSLLNPLANLDAATHLHRVAASLDSMVVGEPQVAAQVREAYEVAARCGAAGPLLEELFHSALRGARRVASETGLHRHRVSIPSVAIADFASRVFETFSDKHVLVLGAGKMGAETLRYLRQAGAERIHVVNRNDEKGERLAAEWQGTFHPWNALCDQLVQADLVISTTSATTPIISAETFGQSVAPARHQRPLLILDLAVPRDFEPAIGDELGVYLYSLDDLDHACEQNRSARAEHLTAAEEIVADQTAQFFADANHRATVPVITGLRRGLEQPKAAELEKLFSKHPELDSQQRADIKQFADRLVNKMLHLPMESLRDASRNGTPHSLLDAVRRLFRLED